MYPNAKMLGMSKFYCQWAGFGGRGDYGGRFYRRRVRFGWKTAGAGNNFYRGGPWGVGAGTDGKLWRIDFTMCQFVLYKCLILQFTIFHFFQFFSKCELKWSWERHCSVLENESCEICGRIFSIILRIFLSYCINSSWVGITFEDWGTVKLDLYLEHRVIFIIALKNISLF